VIKLVHVCWVLLEIEHLWSIVFRVGFTTTAYGGFLHVYRNRLDQYRAGTRQFGGNGMDD
jgi:hypothetical protein